GSYYELRKLDLFEVGPTLVGANQETELLAVKARHLADRVKAGDTIDLDQLEAAHAALGSLLEAAKTSSLSGEDHSKRETGQPDPPAANDPAASGTSAEQPAKST